MKLSEDFKPNAILRILTTDGQKWKVKYKGREGRSLILHDGTAPFKVALRHISQIEVL